VSRQRRGESIEHAAYTMQVLLRLQTQLLPFPRSTFVKLSPICPACVPTSVVLLMPSCPCWLLPQHTMLLSLRRTHVWLAPVDIAIGIGTVASTMEAKKGVSNVRKRVLARTILTDRSIHIDAFPAEIGYLHDLPSYSTIMLKYNHSVSILNSVVGCGFNAHDNSPKECKTKRNHDFLPYFVLSCMIFPTVLRPQLYLICA
jgi:hypothetical protein